MWCRSYRDHAIMAFPSFDTASGLWASQANITWVAGSERESAFVRFPKRAVTEADAVAWALSAAQAWIDKRVKTPPIVSPPQNDIRSGALRADLARGSENHRFPRLAKFSRASGRALTFDQFKSLMGESGHKESEQSLQRSYAALLQLRKRSHRSWAQIKLKIQRPRQTALHSEAFNRKISRLPLTTKEWRRII
jgi:hypothetical protein